MKKNCLNLPMAIISIGFAATFFSAPDAARPAVFPLHVVQGATATSPLVGETVTVGGLVVGDFQETDELRGFFLQEASADDDPATSEGIFVYHDRTDVRVGDRIEFAGRVTEYNGLTEITDVRDLHFRRRDELLPAPAAVTLPVRSSSYLERYEGMRVILPQRLTVSDTGALAAFGSMVLSFGRPMQPTAVAPPGPEALSAAEENSRNRLILDDGRTLVDPIPVPYPAPGLTADNPVRTGYTVTGLVGVIDDRFGEYRFHPTEPVIFERTDNPRTERPALIGRLRVVAFNLRNYFNGPAFPTPRGAVTPEAFERQHAKIVAALSSTAGDVFGLVEMENDGDGPESAVAHLTRGMNLAAPEGVSYDYLRTGEEGLGRDVITNALIYRRETVTPVGPAAVLTGGAFAGTSRPPVAQSFREIATGESFTVVVNHFRSRATPCGDDPGGADLQGNCNTERTRAARELAAWLKTAPFGADDPDILIVGDLNAYAYEDPLTVLREAGYIDLLRDRLGTGAYTYVYDGGAGSLDHALAGPALAAQVHDVGPWHINADEPALLDYTRIRRSEEGPVLYAPDPFRSSDHDPVIIAIDPGGIQFQSGDVVSVLRIVAATGDPAPPFPDLDLDGNHRIDLADAIGLLRRAGAR